MRIALKTLGCKTNHYETDAIRQQFAEAGYAVTDFNAESDIYVINTCTVTGEAERKTRQLLRRAKEKNPAALLAAIGCSVEISGLEDLADICIGNKDKSQTFAIINEKIINGREFQAADRRKDFTYAEYGRITDQSETRAQIKIEDGCDNFCTYCIIPYARGPVRSRERKNIIEEAKALADAGYKEIVLTGVHVCSYGAEWGWPSHAVVELAAELAEIDAIKRIRLGSLEPRSLTDRFIELASSNVKLCPHFHLSLQSGSDETLRQMERNYDSGFYRQIIEKLRQVYADPGITTDIITGFPGETESQHQESLRFCREISFSRMHVFRYSPRQGTGAAARKDRTEASAVSRRAGEMGNLAKELMQKFHLRQVGKKHEIILENNISGYFHGYTEKYVPVRMAYQEGFAEGDLVIARGTSAEESFLLCDNAILADKC